MYPELITIGPCTIYTYGFFVALAFLVGIMTAAARAARYGWNPERIYDAGLYILISAIAGARLLYVLDHLEEFSAAPWEIVMIWRGGLVYYGGVIAAVCAAMIYFRLHALNVGAGFDMVVPSLALGHAIGRVGCFFNGCCYGAVTSRPWGIVFPPESPVYLHQLYETGAIPPDAPASLPVHPAQLYATAAELGIFFLLIYLLPRKRFHGQVFLSYLLLYGIARFLIEFCRADNSPVFFLLGSGLTLPQIMSAALALVAGVILIARGGTRYHGADDGKRNGT